MKKSVRNIFAWRGVFYLFIFSSFHLFIFDVSAQQLSKQLEVRRSYTPQVEEADKLPIEPTPLTKQEMELETPYSITSVARPTPFSPEIYQPVKVEGMDDIPHAIYIRAGVGLPFTTTADIYYTPKMPRGSTLGFFGNHRGSFSNIRNNLKVISPSAEWLAGFGIFGSHEVGRFTLDGDVTFDYRSYQMYGVSAVDVRDFFELPEGASVDRYMAIGTDQNRIGWSRVGARLSFGDTFTDLRHLNFRVTTNLGYAPQAKQTDLDLGVRLGQLFGGGRRFRHGFDVNVWERSSSVKGSEGSALTIGFEPRYVIELGRLTLDGGIDLYYVNNDVWEEPRVNFFGPMFALRWELADGKLIPFASYDSNMLDGSLEALTRRNPYVEGTAPTGFTSDFRVGIEGSKEGSFHYKVYGGASLLEDYHIYVARQDVTIRDNSQNDRYSAYYNPVRFLVSPASGTLYTIGAELGLENLGKFGFDLYAVWNEMKLKDTPLVPDVAQWKAGLHVSYRRTDKLVFRLGGDWFSGRDYNVHYSLSSDSARLRDEDGVGRLRAAVDISAGAELKVVDGFWLWAEGRNLAGLRLYPYPFYKGLGINIMVGAKATF